MSEQKMTWKEWAMIGIVAVMAVLFLCCGGCTDRLDYRHAWTDPNGVPHSVAIVYSEGVGNSSKQAIAIVLGDGASMTLGRSVTDQEAFMAVLSQYGITLERIAEAYMRGPLSAPFIGDGEPTQ